MSAIPEGSWATSNAGFSIRSIRYLRLPPWTLWVAWSRILDAGVRGQGFMPALVVFREVEAAAEKHMQAQLQHNMWGHQRPLRRALDHHRRRQMDQK